MLALASSAGPGQCQDLDRNLVANFHALGSPGAVAEAASAIRRDLAVRFPDLGILAAPGDVFRSDTPAVAIATPVPTHFALARATRLAGKGVFVEKPLTRSLDEAGGEPPCGHPLVRADLQQAQAVLG